MLVGVAAILALTSMRPTPHETPVVVAAHALPAGTVLSDADLHVTSLPTAAIPEGTVGDIAQLVGQQLSGAVTSGEPITSARVADGGELGAAAGDQRVALPVRLADAEAAALVHAGDLVDILAADRAGNGATVAHAVPVLAVPVSATESSGPLDGALIVVAVVPSVAEHLAGAAATGPLTVALHS